MKGWNQVQYNLLQLVVGNGTNFLVPLTCCRRYRAPVRKYPCATEGAIVRPIRLRFFFPPFFAHVTFVNSESAFFRIRTILQDGVCKKLNQEIVSNEVVFWHFKPRKRI